jgi:hypothetical protein
LRFGVEIRDRLKDKYSRQLGEVERLSGVLWQEQNVMQEAKTPLEFTRIT